jgi:hypothetical protein
VASARSGLELNTPATPVRLLSILTVVGVLIGVSGIWLPAFAGGDSRSERRAVTTRAEDFAVAFNTYTIGEKADYQKRMKSLMTPEYYREFTKITDAMFEAIQDENQSSGDAKVLATAVDSIDEDSAVVLVAVNASVKRTGEKAAIERRFRWTVTFGKYEDEWRVRQFDAVAPMQAKLGEVPRSDEGGGQ